MQDFITVKISRSEVQKMLKAVLMENDSEKAELLAKVICENLAGTERGMDNIYLAINGVEREYKYKIGDLVLFNKDYGYTWKMDLEEMEKRGMLFNDLIRGEITAIQPYRNAAYEIKYNYISKDSGLIVEQLGIFAEESKVFADDNYPLEG